MGIYAEHDQKIIDAINDGCVRFNEIVSRTGYEFRLVDRRLQALRRKRKLTFSTAYGWGIFE